MTALIDPDNISPGTSIGVYTVVRRVGAGGFGTLYQVERDGKRYALKLSRERLDGLSPTARKTFEDRTDREVAALKSLRHPNIVSIYAVDRWPELETGYPFLVMEFVEGHRLLPWCAALTPSLLQICGVFEKIAGAVHHMHERQLFHRDLKSENVLVRADGEPVLVDFGIARARSAFRVTGYADVVGTATHYAPEYLKHVGSEAFERGEDFEWTAATDLHSVGYMLYQALVGRAPFEGRTEPEIWKAIQSVQPAAPSLVNPSAPGALDEIVLRLLEKDPRDRFQSGAELAQAIRRVREARAGDPEWQAAFVLSEVPSSRISAPTAAHRPTRRSPPGDSVSEIAPIGGPRASGPRRSSIDDFLAWTPLMQAIAGSAPAPASAPASAPDAGTGAGVTFAPPTAARPAFEPPDREPETAVPSGAPPGLPSSVRRVKEQLERAERGKPRAIPLPAAVGLGVGGLLLAFFILMGAAGKAEPRPTSLMDSVKNERSPLAPPSLLPAPAAVPSKPEPESAQARDTASSVRVEDVRQAVPQGSQSARPSSSTPGTRRPRIARDPEARGDPSWMQRSRSLQAASHAQPKPPTLGIPTGAHIPVKLLTTLDSRTVGSGPVEARLSRPFAIRGETVLPAGTLVYGQASAVDGRFTVRFARLRLPDDREVEFAGLALDRDDGKPGLAASRRFAAAPQQGDGLGTTIAKGTAGIVLGTVTGGLPQDVARGAGQAALGHRESPVSGGGGAQILDPGALFDVWVERPF